MINEVTWLNFVKYCSDSWEDNDITRDLIEIVKCDGIAKVIWRCLRSDSIMWLNSRIPMLDKKRPIDLLSTEEGRDKIRWILMSNPWW